MTLTEALTFARNCYGKGWIIKSPDGRIAKVWDIYTCHDERNRFLCMSKRLGHALTLLEQGISDAAYTRMDDWTVTPLEL